MVRNICVMWVLSKYVSMNRLMTTEVEAKESSAPTYKFYSSIIISIRYLRIIFELTTLKYTCQKQSNLFYIYFNHFNLSKVT